MEKVSRLRAMGSLCRQAAVYNPDRRWKLLAEAEYWEHLALAEVSSYFKECNVGSSNDPAHGEEVPMPMHSRPLKRAFARF
jgi:hypothetical protein